MISKYFKIPYSHGLFLVLAFSVGVTSSNTYASSENRLRRIDVNPHQGFTRISLSFQSSPQYSLKRHREAVEIFVKNSSAPKFKKFRKISDGEIEGIFVYQRGRDLKIVIPTKAAEANAQALSVANPTILSVDVGKSLDHRNLPDIVAGRESILAGTEKVVKEFSVAGRAVLPFVPTDVKVFKDLLSEDELQLFKQAESLLYHEQGADAFKVFDTFLTKPPSVKAIALYRQAECLYLMERYKEALSTFRAAESLWPGYLSKAPSLQQSYAEVLANNGDYEGGRAILIRLINETVGTIYAAPLLNRLADMAARSGKEAQALSIYKEVVKVVPGSAPAWKAHMKLADREIFSISRDRYSSLVHKYQSVFGAPGEPSLRGEALFKMAALHALYGSLSHALDSSIMYEKYFPEGAYITVVKKIREDLVLLAYKEYQAVKDHKGLLQLILSNKSHLSKCFMEPQFFPSLSAAFHAEKQMSKEIDFFRELLANGGAADWAPFMMVHIVRDALALGNIPLAENTAQKFLLQFPRDKGSQEVREQLGRIVYERGELDRSASVLKVLSQEGVTPIFNDSYYYLGKSLKRSQPREAERYLARFVKKTAQDSPLVLDAYFSLGSARTDLEDLKGAMDAYRDGVKISKGEEEDQFLYMIGDLYLQMKDYQQCALSWEKVAAKGVASIWGRMATEALADLKWRQEIGKQFPGGKDIKLN